MPKKEDHEAEINRKIEEIRNRNKEIARRHQEIEADKQNADSFSKVAIEIMKSKPVKSDSAKTQAMPERTEARSTPNKPRKESRRVSNPSVQPPAEVVTYRPPRLSENDLPPPDPVYSFLTDRLRQGSFCAPPRSPPALRRSSTASSTSDWSSSDSSRRSSVSRKLSTASNSSWTSDSSCGFANYQPPRRFSRCHSYVKNRKISDGGYFSPTEETDTELSNFNEEKSRKPSLKEDAIIEREEIRKELPAEEYTSIRKDGNTRNRQQRKKGVREADNLRSDKVLNWRNREEDNNTLEDVAAGEEPTILAIEDAMTGMTLADLNNNQSIPTLNQPSFDCNLLETQ